MNVKERILEVKSWADSDHYYLLLSGHCDVLQTLNVPLIEKIQERLKIAQTSYMPKSTFDQLGSNIRVYSNNYARVVYVMRHSEYEEAEVFSREQMSDCLINDGWKLIGFTALEGLNPQNMTVAEKWTKTME